MSKDHNVAINAVSLNRDIFTIEHKGFNILYELTTGQFYTGIPTIQVQFKNGSVLIPIEQELKTVRQAKLAITKYLKKSCSIPTQSSSRMEPYSKGKNFK